jgi:hypothetical protein
VRQIGIEVELTHKTRRAYDLEVFAKLRAGVEALWYFVPDKAFEDRLRADLRAVLEQRRSNKRFFIQRLPEVPGVTYDGTGWTPRGAGAQSDKSETS